MANEGSYPENARGPAMNGAEVLYRAPYGHDEYRREVTAKQIQPIHKRDIWAPPER
jgi:hypothetical protein